MSVNADGLKAGSEATWFHVFRDMIMSGEVAKMGPYAFTVYCVIKAHTDINNGESFPGIELIAAESGVSVPQVKREIAKLEAMALLTRERSSRKRGRGGVGNTYHLQEKVNLEGSDGSQMGVADWKYVPATVMAAITELKHALTTGDFAGAKTINIALTVNMQNGPGNQVNIGVANGPDVAKEHLDIMKRTVGIDRNPDLI